MNGSAKADGVTKTGGRPGRIAARVAAARAAATRGDAGRGSTGRGSTGRGSTSRGGTARAAAARGAAGALAIVAVLAGCGTAHAPAAGGQPGGTGLAAPASPGASQGGAPQVPAAGQPAGGPVPSGFAATSVTFVAPGEAFALGTAPCRAAPCTSIVHTLDRGGHWRGLPAPTVPVGRPGAGNAVWGIRFASPAHGFVFGSGLWETTDGGAHWLRDPQPAGSVFSLAVIDGQVLALTARCTAQGGCGQTARLLRRPLTGGAWQAAATVRYPGILDPDDLIATQASVAALVDGSRVLVTGDGGFTIRSHPAPCTGLPAGAATSVAVTSPTGLALLCTGQGYMSHTDKRVYVSSDDGGHWRRAGVPGSAGDGGTIGAATPGQLTIATMSAASWLYYSGDGAARWGTSVTRLDGGMGWADLGFTTTTDGVVVYGPALSDGNREHRPGQLLFTGDGGATWQRVRF